MQDGSNWYVYARNNPLIITDPTGLNDDDSKMRGSDFQVDYTEVFVSIYQDDMYYVPSDSGIEGDNIGYFKWGDTFSEDAIIFTGENAMMEFSNSESSYTVWTTEGNQGNVFDITVPNSIQKLRNYFVQCNRHEQEANFYANLGTWGFTVGTTAIATGFGVMALNPEPVTKTIGTVGGFTIGGISVVGGIVSKGISDYHFSEFKKMYYHYKDKEKELQSVESDYYSRIRDLTNTFSGIESQY